MPEFSPEFRLLLAAALYPLQPPEIEHLRTCCDSNVDWPVFAALVERHRLIPTVYRNLSSYAAGLVPEAVLAGYKEKARLNQQRILQILVELGRIGQSFAAEEIKLCTLKGPLLAQRLFNDVSLRTSRDLDLLVQPAALMQADALLLTYGCQRSLPAAPLTPRQWQVYQQDWYHNIYFLPGPNLYVELHWALASPQLVAPQLVQQIFSRARPCRLSGSNIYTLADQDLSFYLVVHGSKDNWARLKWLVDFAVWMRGAADQDWHALIAGIETAGLQRSLAQGVLLANWLFAPPVPGPAAELVASEPSAQGLAEYALKAILDASYTGTEVGQFQRFKNILYLTKLKPSLRYKWAVFSKAWVIPHDWQELPLPDALFPLYWLLRPFLWLRRYHLRLARSSRSHPL